MNSSNLNYHLDEDFYFVNKSGQFFSFQLIHTPILSISMSEEKLLNENEGNTTTLTTNKEMTSMNEAIAFIVQLVHQKTLEGYTLVDALKRAQNKELSIKNENISEMPLEISSNPSEGSLSPSKSPSSQTEYLLVSEKNSKSDGKSASEEFEIIERKESEGKESKDFEQENSPIEVCISNTLSGQALKIIDLEQEDFDDHMCTEDISISTFHRVNKEGILKKAEELNIECDFRYCLMIISGLSQNINEFKDYLNQVETSTKEALYPKYWDLKDTNMYSEIEVAHDSKEFEEITSLMTKDFAGAQVLRLRRVQNNSLMNQYITNLNMRQEVSQEKLNRKLLFYGTNQVDPSKISKTGFDIQYGDEGSLFRKGLYFAQHASDSHAFAFPVNFQEDKYELILADALVGKPYKGLELNKLKPPEVYIISNNLHSYPLYLIEYTTQKKTAPRRLRIRENVSDYLLSPTEVHKLNFTPINTSSNINLNYLAPPPSSHVPDNQAEKKYHGGLLSKFSKSYRPPIYNNRLSASALIRVNKDIIAIQNDATVDFFFVEQPDETDLSKCILCLIGPPYSAYEGGIFRIELIFPDDYPLNPPLVRFLTKIYHPCIDATGKICLGLLNQWTPSGSVTQIGLLISALLDNPRLEEPLLPELLSNYETNRQNFVSQARSWTQKYAQ